MLEQEVYISNMLGLVAGNVSMVARIKLQALPYGESSSVTISHHYVIQVCQQVRVQEQQPSHAPDRHHRHWQSKHEKTSQPPRAWATSQPDCAASQPIPWDAGQHGIAAVSYSETTSGEIRKDWVSCKHSCDKATVCPVAMCPWRHPSYNLLCCPAVGMSLFCTG